MLVRGLAVAILVAVLDQASKTGVLAFFGEPGCAFHRLALAPFFNFVLTCNPGVSFGMFNEAGVNALIFAVFSMAVVAALVIWLARVRGLLLAVAIGLVIGGAIGNVIDRLRFCAVIDFLDFHLGTWHWPAFNLADSAICLGVAAMLLDGLLSRRNERQAQEGELLRHDR